MDIEQVKTCRICNETKSLTFICKGGGGTYRNLCKECSNKIKRDERKRVSDVINADIKTVYIPKHTVTPYVPQTVWVRNNGLKHIPSRGFSC